MSIVYGKSELAVAAESSHLQRKGWVKVGHILYNPNSVSRPYSQQLVMPIMIDEG